MKFDGKVRGAGVGSRAVSGGRGVPSLRRMLAQTTMLGLVASMKAVTRIGAPAIVAAAAIGAPAIAAPMVLEGDFIRIGLNDRGTLGYGGNASPGILYDGAGTGTFNPAYDYLTPGAPFEAFTIQGGHAGGAIVDSSNNEVYFNASQLVGSVVDYSGVARNGVTYDNRAIYTGVIAGVLEVEHDYYFNDDSEQLRIRTTIRALTDLTNLTFARAIDPDAAAAPGDSPITNNFRGTSVIPETDLVYAEALVSKYVIGLYTNSPFTHNAAVTDWTQDTASYISGTNEGSGDNTIGLGFVLGALANGGSLAFDYMYIFGADIDAAVSGGGIGSIGPINDDFTTDDLADGLVTAVFDGGELEVAAPGATTNDFVVAPAGGQINTAGNDATFSGVFSGDGALVKAGAGLLNLTGTSTFSGPVLVNEGRLAVNGSLSSSLVTVAPGASVGGNGVLGGLVVRAGATAAPGNSIGVLTVATSVLFEVGSIYEVEINPAGASDRILASGAMLIEGGVVSVLAEAGSYDRRTTYTILSSAAGVTGRFAGVTSNLTFLSPTLTYLPDAVLLTMTRNDVDFLAAAATHNQRNTAFALDNGAISPSGVIYDQLVVMSDAQARAAFDAMSGESHASVLAAAVGEADGLRRSLIGRLDARRSAGVRMWGEFIGSRGKLDGDSGAAGVDSYARGFTMGVEAEQDGFMIGVAGGYTEGDVKVAARRADIDLTSAHFGIYGGATLGAVRLRVGASYADFDVRSERYAQVGLLSEQLLSEYGGATSQIFAEAGYAFQFEQAVVEPFVGLDAVWIGNDAFSERGASMALSGEDRTRELAWSTIGVKGEFALGGDVTAQIKGGWRHALTDERVDSVMSFVSGGPRFNVEAAPLARDAGVIDASVNWRASEMVDLGFGYAGAFGDATQNHTARAVVNVGF